MGKNMQFGSLRNFIANKRRVAAATIAVAATGECVGPHVASVHVAHVQDETALRLPSSDPNSRTGLPRRSRTSKVQMHVATVTCGVGEQRLWEIPVELKGLTDKTAATLATSSDRLLKTLLEQVLPQSLPATGGRRKDSNPEL